jgi:hypothetical protein
MTTGTATFATVIAAPISTVPARAAGRPPSDRTTIPTSSTPGPRARPPEAEPGQQRRGGRCGQPEAEHRKAGQEADGAAVHAQVGADPSVTGETATIGPRMLSASSRMAAMSSARRHGDAGGHGRRGVTGSSSAAGTGTIIVIVSNANG